jgi:hypothetical protein
LVTPVLEDFDDSADLDADTSDLDADPLPLLLDAAFFLEDFSEAEGALFLAFFGGGVASSSSLPASESSGVLLE